MFAIINRETQVSGQELSDVKRLKAELFVNNSYDKNIRPVRIQSSTITVGIIIIFFFFLINNPSPAEPGYALPLQIVYIQIDCLLKKPTDLDLHCCH